MAWGLWLADPGCHRPGLLLEAVAAPWRSPIRLAGVLGGVSACCLRLTLNVLRWLGL